MNDDTGEQTRPERAEMMEIDNRRRGTVLRKTMRRALATALLLAVA
jgi:hypothetical protein